MIAEASYTAADDGTTRITVLIMRRLPEADWISPAQSRTHQQVIVPMGIDPAFVTRVAGALAG